MKLMLAANSGSLPSLGATAAAVVAVFLVSSSSTSMVAEAAAIETCGQQSKCLKWEVTKVPGTSCGITADLCPVQVCMKFDLDAPGCVKGTAPGDSVSHACDNANATGCVRTKPWLNGPNSDKGKSVDLDDSGVCTGPFSDRKCPTIRDEYRMCQIGKPGDTLYFTVYVFDR